MNRQENAIQIGEKLREVRGIRPKTKVAQAIGISYSALCKYEAGLRTPSGPTKIRIANYYGVTVEELFYSIKNHET